MFHRKKTLLIIAVISFTMFNYVKAQNLGQKILFNDNWKFAKEEFKDASVFKFDDSNWQNVTLPHDWAIAGPFAEEFGPRSGGLPIYGIGWYRKHFKVSNKEIGKQVILHFDGAMSNSEVFVNGKLIGKRPYGYSAFSYDISAYLNYNGKNNIIAIKLSPEELSSRWYPGAGLYRNVWIEYNNPIHLKNWGITVTTPDASEKQSTINIKSIIENSSKKNKSELLEVTIIDKANHIVGKAVNTIVVGAKNNRTSQINLNLQSPQLWKITDPYLYKAIVRIKDHNTIIDQEIIPFGIRTIKFTPNGFYLNGQLTKFKGVCMHSDLGPLGAVTNYRGLERQLEIMKNMGANALRTSHNPPSAEQLDICDKLGILVIVEAFDAWQMSKVPNDYSRDFDQWHDKDLTDMIQCDKNHPSIIMWSIGNEILEQGQKDIGAKIARELTAIVHREDKTRPSTAAFNNYSGAINNKLADEVDVVGFNYKAPLYKTLRAEHPNWIIYGSETESTVSSRGIYHLPIEKYEKHPSRQITSYDIIGPPWAYPPDVEFDFEKQTPEILGEFVWTGFDYLGEPTPYGGKDNDTQGGWKGDWVSRSSYFGIVDLVGFPKDRYYLYQSQWTSKPMIHLLPHWNWEASQNSQYGKGKRSTGMLGKIIPVMCYTNVDEAELFLNGKSLGRKVKSKDETIIPVSFTTYTGSNKYPSQYRLSWDVPYEPGELKVVGYKDNEKVVQEIIKTSGTPAKIELIPDRKLITADGYDLSYITVKIEDKKGNLCPTADNLVRFAVNGAGQFEAVDNGNPATTLLFNEPYRPAFNGLCMLIVRSKRGVKGAITIDAKSDKLLSTQIKIYSK